MEQSQRDDSLAVRGARSVSSLPPPAYPRPLHAHVTFIPRLYTQVKKTRGCCSRVGLLHWILLLPRALDAFAYGRTGRHCCTRALPGPGEQGGSARAPTPCPLPPAAVGRPFFLRILLSRVTGSRHSGFGLQQLWLTA